MPNLKWGIISGVAAIVLSLALGLLHGALPSFVIVRALLCGIVFFVGGVGVYFLVNSYFPELLFPGTEGGAAADAVFFSAEPESGTRVNITVGDTSGAALPKAEQGGPESDNDVESLSDLLSGAVNPAARAQADMDGQSIDQNTVHGYTYGRGAVAEGGSQDSAGLTGEEGFGDAMSGGGDAFGGLPDLDALTGSFVGGTDTLAQPSSTPAESYESFLPERKPSSGKAKEFEGDFNPKEIAAGIRTVLSKDKQG